MRALGGDLRQVKDVVVNPGESSLAFSLDKLRPGAVEIKATHRELLAGGTFISVRERTLNKSRARSTATLRVMRRFRWYVTWFARGTR